jgi:hypothetical protein
VDVKAMNGEWGIGGAHPACRSFFMQYLAAMSTIHQIIIGGISNSRTIINVSCFECEHFIIILPQYFLYAWDGNIILGKKFSQCYPPRNIFQFF